MAKIETVIKGLETCIPMKYETNEEKECRHEQCPYGRENYKPMNGCFWDLMADALELLKEQQAEIGSFKAEQHPRKVKNMRDLADLTVGECPSCGEYINNEICPNFCGWCGDRLDWSKDGEQE